MAITDGSRAASITRLALTALVGFPAALLAVIFIAGASWIGFVGIVAPGYLTWTWLADVRAMFNHDYPQPRFYLLAVAASVALMAFYAVWLAVTAP